MPLLAHGGEAVQPPAGAFAGLVHVRFSFDRAGLRDRMQGALMAAAQHEAEPRAMWLPPPIEAGLPAAAAALERSLVLQPDAGAVAAATAGLQERGAQRLNAEQRQAVAAVVCGAGRAFPFALFGPPGARAGAPRAARQGGSGLPGWCRRAPALMADPALPLPVLLQAPARP